MVILTSSSEKRVAHFLRKGKNSLENIVQRKPIPKTRLLRRRFPRNRIPETNSRNRISEWLLVQSHATNLPLSNHESAFVAAAAMFQNGISANALRSRPSIFAKISLEPIAKFTIRVRWHAMRRPWSFQGLWDAHFWSSFQFLLSHTIHSRCRTINFFEQTQIYKVKLVLNTSKCPNDLFELDRQSVLDWYQSR